MARKYRKKASRKVAKVMRERKRGTLRSGRSGKKVTSRKQAIAIGLSEARRAGARVAGRKRGAQAASGRLRAGCRRQGGPGRACRVAGRAAAGKRNSGQETPSAG